MQRFKVSGMSCNSCVKAVTQAIRAVDRSASVEIDLPAGEATVEAKTDTSSVIAAIRAAGFGAEEITE